MATITWFMLAAIVAAPAGDPEVRLVASSLNVYAGVPFTVGLDVTSPSTPARPTIPELKNATVVSAGQSSMQSSNLQITINGRQMVSTTTTRYLYKITPHRPGQLRIPPIPVEIDGRRYATKQAVFEVVESAADDLIFVGARAKHQSVYVGEQVEVILEVWLKPAEDGGSPLSESDMWQFIDKQVSTWGVFTDQIDARGRNVSCRTARRPDGGGRRSSYYVYMLEKTIWPTRSGTLDLGDARIVVEYPLEIRRTRGFFARRQVTQSRPVVGVLGESPVTVKAIPTEGRPPYFYGAVGPHTITTSASPTEVRVGDPITLNIKVRGSGQLGTLQAPPLASFSEFTERFQVLDEQLPGIVKGNAKRFTQSIRALSDAVSEVPSIPLAYFDPASETFVTVESKPIPLTVASSERLSATQIVESGPVGGSGGMVRSLTASGRGIESNQTDLGALFAVKTLQPSRETLIAAGASPLLYLGCLVIQRRRARWAGDSGLRRRRQARRAALARLSRVQVQDARAVAATTAGALLGYIADRRGLPAGGLTRAEAMERLRECSVPEVLVAEVDGVLRDCEAAGYGAGSVDGAALVKGARGCVKRLEGAGV